MDYYGAGLIQLLFYFYKKEMINMNEIDKSRIRALSKYECSKDCPFNDNETYCELFEAPIGNSEEINIRCSECIEIENIISRNKNN